MTSIIQVLQPEHVNLALGGTDKTSAIEEVLSKLEGDPRVLSYPDLAAAVHTRDAPAIAEHNAGICLAHGRTEAVSSIVLAAGRSAHGFHCGEIKAPVRLVFVAGIPGAFNSEYLRIVGAIARYCSDAQRMNHLLSVKTAAEFIDLLHSGEVKL